VCEHPRSLRSEFGCNWTLTELVRLCRGLPELEYLTLTGGDPLLWEPLEEFLQWFGARRLAGVSRTKLMVKTTFAPGRSLSDYWNCVDQIQFSLDTVDPVLYYELRGVSWNPLDLLKGITSSAQGQKVTVLTVVTTKNASMIYSLGDALAETHKKTGAIRKWVLLPVLGARSKDIGLSMLKWDVLSRGVGTKQAQGRYPFPVGTEALVPSQLQGMMALAPVKKCYVSRLAFHAKANGDTYPCCMTGGESLVTQEEFCFGNLRKAGIVPELVREQAKLQPTTAFCQEFCQIKYYRVNRAAMEAEATYLSMP